MIKDTNQYIETQKQDIQEQIEEMISKNAELIDQMEKVGREIKIDSRVPNIGITLNNKINEISQEFEEAGISMFAREQNGFPVPNPVGQAILLDLTSKTSDGIKALSEYDSATEKLVNKNMGGPLKKLFFIVKNTLFKMNTLANEKETKEISSHLAEYKQKNEEIYGYNLRDNLVPTLAKDIIRGRELYSITGCSDKSRLEYEVEPVLKALGLEELMPKLMEQLKEEKQPESLDDKKSWDLENWGIDAEEFRKGASEISLNNGRETNENEISEMKSIHSEDNTR